MKRKHRFHVVQGLVVCLGAALIGCSSLSKQDLKQESKQEGSEVSKSIINHQILPLTGPIQVHRYTYKNGLKLLVIEDHSSPTFAYQTWYKVGSRDEDPGRTGLAHLFEHMMFKETKNLKDGEFERLLEQAGAEGNNAFTNRDFTAYVQELPKDKLDLIARLEAERAQNLIVNDEAFKTEREVVQNERRFRYENSPDGIMYQEIFGLAFKKHPYHWPVIGYQKDLDSMTSKDALNFYRKYYSPNHATVFVIGDVIADQVSEVVDRYYGHLKGIPEPSQDIAPEPLQKTPRIKKLPLNVQVQKLLMGYHIPEVVHEDMPTLDVIQSILTSGNSSRLARALVNTGIATSVDSDNFEDKDPSLFLFGVNLQQKKTAIQAESVILRELKRLGTEKVADEELKRAKNKLDFAFYQGLESNTQKAYFMGLYESVAGDFNMGMIQHERIRDVTAVDIQRVAKKYFNPNSRTVIYGVQKK